MTPQQRKKKLTQDELLHKATIAKLEKDNKTECEQASTTPGPQVLHVPSLGQAKRELQLHDQEIAQLRKRLEELDVSRQTWQNLYLRAIDRERSAAFDTSFSNGDCATPMVRY